MESYEQILHSNKILFQIAIQKAKAHGDNNDFEQVLQWCSLAALYAGDKNQFGILSSVELETELQRAAKSIPRPTTYCYPDTRKRWLHVFSMAFETWGHTNLCRRWINYDSTVTHSIVLLNQDTEAPSNLMDAVKTTNGKCFRFDRSISLIERSAQLRKYAWESADVVVLHTHPNDVIATTAFGIDGGPPVLYVNHADHDFWVGCSVADLVLDIRPSGQAWTKQIRGIQRTTILPIPLLLDENTSKNEEIWNLNLNKCQLRRILGLPEEGVMILTVGQSHKYKAIPGFDFVQTALKILQACKGAYLVAIGPENEGEWKNAKLITNGRVFPLGFRTNSLLFCKAADVYLEGFPLGSLTALLEAGLSGLPCVLAPEGCKPPYTSDSMSLNKIQAQPASVDDYIFQAINQVNGLMDNVEIVEKLRASIYSQHCNDGWRSCLNSVKNQIPKEHSTYLDFYPTFVDKNSLQWFLNVKFQGNVNKTAINIATDFLIDAWRLTDEKPLFDEQLLDNLKKFPTSGTYLYQSNIISKLARLFRLGWLNQKVSRLGWHEQLVSKAYIFSQNSKFSTAQRLVWLSFLINPLCLMNQDWLRFFIKTHLGKRLTKYYQRVKG